MDNKAYEQYKAQQGPEHHAVREVSIIDPWDGEMTNTEIVVVALFAILIIYAILQMFKKKE